MKRLSFIAATDSYLLRKGLVSIINRLPAYVSVKEFDSYETLSGYLGHHDPDFLLIGESFLGHISELFLSRPDLAEKVILIARDRDKGSSLGIQNFIHPDDKKEKIFKLLEGLMGRKTASGSFSGEELTPRERTIVRMISLGRTNKQIAEELFLSTHTVITHRKNIIGKLGIKSVSGLTVYAIVNNIITIGEVSLKPNS